MILYVNGCSHTAAAEAVVHAAFADDDGRHGIDRRPHPENLRASWCTHVAQALGAELVCDAESGGSNPRIIRTTRDWIAANPDLWSQTMVIVQWTTWEREEWLHQGTWYQVNASGQDWVPEELQDRYRQFVINVNWKKSTQRCHDQAWELHQWLANKSIKHLFFSGHTEFTSVQTKLNWGQSYMFPYDRDQSYHNWLIKNGGQYANPRSCHFDAKSHRLWANYVLQYLYRNQLVDCNGEVPTD